MLGKGLPTLLLYSILLIKFNEMGKPSFIINLQIRRFGLRKVSAVLFTKLNVVLKIYIFFVYLLNRCSVKCFFFGI